MTATNTRRPSPFWLRIANMLAVVLLFNYGIVVAFPLTLGSGILVSIAFGIFCVVIFSVRSARSLTEIDAKYLPVFVILVLATTLVSVWHPFTLWDARAIWFLHAKVIYESNGLFRPLWPEWAVFTHPDYPNMVPILAAEISHVAGYWNEQLPKLSLVITLLPITAVVTAYWHARLMGAALLYLLWMKFGYQTTDGGMDGPLAAYGLCACLLVGSWLVEAGTTTELVGGILFTGITLGLKNEGELFVVAIIVSAAGLAFARRHARSANRDRMSRNDVIVVSGAALFAAGTAGAWMVVRAQWGFHNDLHLGFHSLSIIFDRLSQIYPPVSVVYHTLITDTMIFAVIIGLLCTWLHGTIDPAGCLKAVFTMTVGTIYFLVLELVYMSTPYDFHWQLLTSADRTTLLPTLLFLAPAVLLLGEDVSTLKQGCLSLIRRRFPDHLNPDTRS